MSVLFSARLAALLTGLALILLAFTLAY